MASVDILSVRKAFGATQILHGVSVPIADGEFVVLVGPSGCGKSTLLRMIAGLENISAGEIRIGERVVNSLPPKARDVAMVFQNYALYPHMTVAANMGFSLKLRGTDNSEIAARVDKAAGILGLTPLLERYPRQLSGGQRQRIALARALAVEPRVLLLDEPFGALDAQVRKDLRRWLREIHDRTGQTTIFVTHDQDEALELSDRVAVLDKGRLEQVGTPDEVQENPVSATVLKFLGDTIEVEAIAQDGQVSVDGKLTPVVGKRGLTGPVKLYARPWQLQFAESSEAHLHGTVRSSYRTQGRQRIEVDRTEGKTVVVEASDTARLAAGLPVGLRIVGGYVFAE